MKRFSKPFHLFAFRLQLLQSAAPLIKHRSLIGYTPYFKLLAVPLVYGVFCRFTFLVFVFPLALSMFNLFRKQRILFAGLPYPFDSFIWLSLGLVLCFVFYDSCYFSESRLPSLVRVWAPFNALLYNLKPSNLSQHGLHPRWLHSVVNAPMLLGLPLVAFLWFRLIEYYFISNQSQEFWELKTIFLLKEKSYETSDKNPFPDRTGEIRFQKIKYDSTEF